MRLTYRQVYARIGRFGSALAADGFRQGGVIAVMDHDSHRYLECYFAIPMTGATMMTVNTKLTTAQIAYTLNHSRAAILLLHVDFIPVIDSIRAELSGIRKFIVMTDGAAIPLNALQFDDEYES